MQTGRRLRKREKKKKKKGKGAANLEAESKARKQLTSLTYIQKRHTSGSSFQVM